MQRTTDRQGEKNPTAENKRNDGFSPLLKEHHLRSRSAKFESWTFSENERKRSQQSVRGQAVQKLSSIPGFLRSVHPFITPQMPVNRSLFVNGVRRCLLNVSSLHWSSRAFLRSQNVSQGEDIGKPTVFDSSKGYITRVLPSTSSKKLGFFNIQQKSKALKNGHSCYPPEMFKASFLIGWNAVTWGV